MVRIKQKKLNCKGTISVIIITDPLKTEVACLINHNHYMYVLRKQN